MQCAQVDDGPALDDGFHGCEVRDVIEWILLEQDQVGELPPLNRAEILFDADVDRRVARRDRNAVEQRDPGLGIVLELLQAHRSERAVAAEGQSHTARMQAAYVLVQVGNHRLETRRHAGSPVAFALIDRLKPQRLGIERCPEEQRVEPADIVGDARDIREHRERRRQRNALRCS